MRQIVVIKFLIVITFLLFAFSLWHRTPDIDDAWIGEHAYWMAEKGYVKSELMHGITGQDVRHIVHHKAFTLNGALFIKLFGFSLMTLKSVSLLWLAIFLIAFIVYVKKELGNNTAWFAFMLALTNALVFQYAFVFRPEIMVMSLGFFSYLFLEKAITSEKKIKYLIISGLFAGLAAATHLNGLIFMAAGVILLFWKRQFKSSVVFAFSTLPAFSLYFYDFTHQYGIDYWLYQINDSPALYKSSLLPSSLSFFVKMLNEHLRFFHSPKEITFSLLFIFLLVVNFRNLKTSGTLLKYLLLLIITLSMLAVHSTSKYILLYLPYIMLIIIRSFHFLYENRASKLHLLWKFNTLNAYKWTLVFLSLYLVVNTAWNIEIAMKKFDPADNRQLAEKFMGNQTANLRILAPMTFIFNEIVNFKSIQSDLSITEMHKDGKSLFGTTFLQYADSLHIDYLIITDEYKDRFGFNSLKPIDFDKNNYLVSVNEKGLLLLKNKHDLSDE